MNWEGSSKSSVFPVYLATLSFSSFFGKIPSNNSQFDGVSNVSSYVSNASSKSSGSKPIFFKQMFIFCERRSSTNVAFFF